MFICSARVLLRASSCGPSQCSKASPSSLFPPLTPDLLQGSRAPFVPGAACRRDVDLQEMSPKKKKNLSKKNMWVVQQLSGTKSTRVLVRLWETRLTECLRASFLLSDRLFTLPPIFFPFFHLSPCKHPFCDLPTLQASRIAKSCHTAQGFKPSSQPDNPPWWRQGWWPSSRTITDIGSLVTVCPGCPQLCGVSEMFYCCFTLSSQSHHKLNLKIFMILYNRTLMEVPK